MTTIDPYGTGGIQTEASTSLNVAVPRRSAYQEHGCRVYWGSHGCDLYRGHDDDHVCLSPVNNDADQPDTSQKICNQQRQDYPHLFGEDAPDDDAT